MVDHGDVEAFPKRCGSLKAITYNQLNEFACRNIWTVMGSCHLVNPQIVSHFGMNTACDRSLLYYAWQNSIEQDKDNEIETVEV